MGRHNKLGNDRHTRVSRLRDWGALLALFAILVQNIVPFGQALAVEPGSDVDYQIVCTASGIKQVPLGEDGQPVDPQGAEFCPFCFISSAPLFLEPAFEIAVQRIERGEHRTIAIAPSSELPSLWRTIPRPSRAPPLNV